MSALLVGTALVFAIGPEDKEAPALDAVSVGVLSAAGELLAALSFAEDVLLSEVPPATEPVSSPELRLMMRRA